MSNRHHHDSELQDLLKALTRLVHSIDRWVRQHLGHKPKPEVGELVFTPGRIAPKKVKP